MTTTNPYAELVSPVGRLVWINNVFRAGVPDGVADAEPAYNVGIIVEKRAAAADPAFAALIAAAKNGAAAKFGDAALVRRQDGSVGLNIKFTSLIDGDAKKGEHLHGHWIINPRCSENEGPPVVLLPDGQQIEQDDRRDHVFAGADAQLLVRPYYWDKGGRGGAFKFLALKLTGTGERVTAKPVDADDARAHFEAAGALPAGTAAAALPAAAAPAPVAQAAPMVVAATNPAPAAVAPAPAVAVAAPAAAVAAPAAAAAPDPLGDSEGDFENAPW